MMKKFLIGCGGSFVLLLVLVIGAAAWLGIQIESGDVPDTTIIPGSKLSDAASEAIASAITLRPDESIQYFYSGGLISWKNDGNIITNQRVASYFLDEGKLSVAEVDYADIEDSVSSFNDGWAEDSILTLTTKDQQVIMLTLSNENGLDHVAIEYVERQIDSAKGVPEDE